MYRLNNKLWVWTLLATLPLAASVEARAQNRLGLIRLEVNATDAPRRILHAKLEIPAHPGPLTLVYPKWIPGEHAPDGPITNLVGLKFYAEGKRLDWHADLVDMYAFHLNVPKGATAVSVELDFVTTMLDAGIADAAIATDKLLILEWNDVLLYPQGQLPRDLTFEPRLQLPPGWQFGTALPIAHRAGATVDFQSVSLNTLVDSPVLCGSYFRVIPLAPRPLTEIDMAADSPQALEVPPPIIANYKRLVAETGALFNSHHYRDYHFLLTLSDYVHSGGLEHHESSDNRVPERYFLDRDLFLNRADLLPHEYVHSWNGKYRRPFDLATPDYQTPMKDDLLWIYEGLTQYWSAVLTTRSGFWTPEQFRDQLAFDASTFDHEPGRTWRSLQNTADAAQVVYRAPRTWTSWRRVGADFYNEGVLIWLEADTSIRRLTDGRRSLDDFARQFYGGPSGVPVVKTYTLDDVLVSLDHIAPYDWKRLFTERLNSNAPQAPLGGIQAAGWRLIYNDQPNIQLAASEKARKDIDLTSSIGLIVGDNGRIIDAIPGMPAAAAGIAPDMTLVAVNGKQFSPEVLRAAILATENNSSPMALLASNTGYVGLYEVNYHGGPRYPHLERIPGQPDLLAEIIQPLASGKH